DPHACDYLNDTETLEHTIEDDRQQRRCDVHLEAGDVDRVLHSCELGRQLLEVRPPLPHGVEVHRQGGLVGDFPHRVPLGIPERHDVVRVGDLETAHAALDHAPHLFHGGLDEGVGDAGKAGVTVGVRVAEAG